MGLPTTAGWAPPCFAATQLRSVSRLSRIAIVGSSRAGAMVARCPVVGLANAAASPIAGPAGAPSWRFVSFAEHRSSPDVPMATGEARTGSGRWVGDGPSGGRGHVARRSGRRGFLASIAIAVSVAGDAVARVNIASGDSFSIATGQIDENVEGVFTLDFITGDLMCFVVSVRTGRINGVFRYNVVGDLQVERNKRPKYLLATGQAIFVTGGNLRALGNSVVYVADANTGIVGAYGVPWDRPTSVAGMPQNGALVPLDRVKAARWRFAAKALAVGHPGVEGRRWFDSESS